MSLLVDRRGELSGKPSLHALLVGVSEYPHLPGGGGAQAPNAFGMKQLKSPALTAYRLFKWLEKQKDKLAVPLATCRVLASPSAEEKRVEPTLNKWGGGATWNDFAVAVKEWRETAKSNPADYTFFYFGGHGVQRSKADSVILLRDFGDGVGGSLTHAATINNIRNGMAPSPSFKDIARQQFYFIDACRVLPGHFKKEELQTVPAVWSVELEGEDDRKSAVYNASLAGTQAYAIDSEPTLFGQALLRCLEGAAAQANAESGTTEYFISSFSLSKALPVCIDDLNRKWDGDQKCEPTVINDARLAYLEEQPLVDVVLEVDPPEALPFASVEIEDCQPGVPAFKPMHPVNPHPRPLQLPLSSYRLRATITPPMALYTDSPDVIVHAEGARKNWKVRCRR